MDNANEIDFNVMSVDEIDFPAMYSDYIQYRFEMFQAVSDIFSLLQFFIIAIGVYLFFKLSFWVVNEFL